MDQHDLETGVEIGDFRIESRLGAGGMGIVYRARQVSLDRVVALKVLGVALNRLDSREIKAERPAGIMVLAFAHFLASALSAIVAAWMILMATVISSETFIKSMGARDVDPLSAQGFRDGLVIGIAVAALTSAGLALVGFGLLAANRWARWGAIVLYSSLAVWTLFQTIQELLRGRVTVDLVFETVLLSLTCFTIAYLSRRSVCDWFRFAARLRAEHRHSPRTAGGRDRKH
jgi:hypothetical protein